MSTLTTPRALIEAGLGPPEREPEWRAVAARYAIAVPPALAALIDRERSRRPDRAPVPARRPRTRSRPPEERDDPIGDDLKSPTRGLVHRYPDRVLLKLVVGLRGLLPLLLPPRERRARRGGARRGRARGGARLYPRAAGNLGGRADRRRSARAVAAPARGGRRGRSADDRACQGAALAHAAAGRRARAGDAGARRRR